jgi:TetR/AcrR family transcriptional repressor of nem operon
MCILHRMNAVANNPVGRPRSFDEDVVLASAMDLFWRKGFDGTSMTDLLSVTGLHKGSLYQAFGDKHSLFIRALKAYIATMKEKMTGILRDAPSGVEGLRAALYHHIEIGAREEGDNCGCLALNSLVETAPHDPMVMEVLETAYAMRMKLIGEAVSRAQAEGGLRSDWSPERLANLIATTEAGVMVELRGPLDETGARAMIDDLLSTLA